MTVGLNKDAVEQAIEQSTGDNAEIDRHLIKVAYDSHPASAIGIALVSVVIVVGLWQQIDSSLLMAWLILQLGISAWRIVLYSAFKKTDQDSFDSEYWKDRFLFVVTLSGIAWGIAPYFLVPPDQVIYQSLVLTVLLGVASASVTTLASIPISLYWFITLILTPVMLRMASLGTFTGTSLVILSFALAIMLANGASRYHRTLVQMMQMRGNEARVKGQIEYQAKHDELTGLPNRRHLRERLLIEMNRAGRQGKFGAVLFMDLDRFKVVNDSLGHQIGDELLCHVADRLRNSVRKEDVVGRLAGDEFVVLAVDLGADAEHAARAANLTAQQIQQALAVPAKIQGHNLATHTSIGIALFAGKEDSPDTILKQADSAMYQAKSSGRNLISFFHASMQESADRELRLQTQLREAINRREFEFHFQVIENLEGQTIGAEALLRWSHPEEGIIMPDTFIPVAEESGLIHALGNEVLSMACESIQTLRDFSNCRDDFVLSINISPKEFSHVAFAGEFIRIVTDAGIDPKNLQVELTENVLLMDIQDAQTKIKQLKKLGVKFAIDDFGTGQSSLAYIKHLPVDTLKIDRCFIKDICTDIVDATIVETTVNMAKRLGLNVVAEGVEDVETRDLLAELGCSAVQGYYLGRPEPFQDFSRRVR